MSDAVVHITSADEFAALISSTKYVVADFYADWCPPCKAIAPLYAKMAGANARAGRLAFAKINVDHVPAVAQAYAVSAMPTFLFFAAGTPQPVAAPGAPAGPCVQLVDGGKVNQIRGADPRALNAVVTALSALAKADDDGDAAPPKSVEGEAEQKPVAKDIEAVST